MPRGSQLSVLEKTRNTALREGDLSVAEIAKRAKRSERHVIYSRHGYYKKKRSRRSQKLSARDKRRVAAHFSNTMSSLRKAPAELGLDVSHETIRPAIKKTKIIVHGCPRLTTTS